jgi:GR25 family glycosyltransferase involved in LPS biosynthesis
MKAFLRISIAIFAVIILTFVLFCSIHKLPTKQLKIEDIKSISVLNFNKDRRMKYEQNLKNKFGKYFLGHKIKDLRLKNTCNGKQELFAENIVNGKIVTYNDVKDKEGHSIFKDGIWKICSKYKKNECVYYSSVIERQFNNGNYYIDSEMFSVFGCFFSHMRAIEKIAKQPDNTYGLIFEDDFDVSDNFDNDIKEAFKAVPKDFDILKLTLDGISIKKRRRKLLFIKALKEEIKSYIKNGYDEWIDLSVQNEVNRKLSVGAQAYLVSSQGARKILSFVRNNITLCVADIDVFYYIPKFNNDIKAYFYTGNVPFILNNSADESIIES